jgi:hypothetical protein
MTRRALLTTAAVIVGASGIAVAVALPRCETFSVFGGTCGTPIWVRLAVAGAGLFVAAVLMAFAVGSRDSDREND